MKKAASISDEKALKTASKKNLKTMRKLQDRHFVRERTRIVKYGTRGFARNFWLSTAATIVMSLTLVILFITVVASVILSNTADVMRDKIDITIYFKPNTSERNLEKLSAIISADPNILRSKNMKSCSPSMLMNRALLIFWMMKCVTF